VSERWLRILLVVLGVVTAGPVLALVAPESTLRAGYGVEHTEPMVRALLQHRGVLQLVLGAAIAWAAFVRSVRIPVALAAITTKGSFCALVLPFADLREDWPKPVAVFDIACIVILGAFAVRERNATRVA